ncbi:hypothetical protein GXY_14063 [Novacetimonas hansenii ATCC 23769]|uniref:Uncharacterized protein n=1 Tax=Novacetimonas hansenii ATCC 23769 TaxID=714995 RepID=D5QI32_NOVHA|nr:hypothetical protein GXY_14063 [Novacetimonas hansenii ATCC 23769]
MAGRMVGMKPWPAMVWVWCAVDAASRVQAWPDVWMPGT